jgi:hypothetical protein
MPLIAQGADSFKNCSLMTSVSYYEAQLDDLATCFTRQLNDFVNENNREIVNDKPAEIF